MGSAPPTPYPTIGEVGRGRRPLPTSPTDQDCTTSTMTFPITTPLDGTWQLRPTDTFRQGFYPLDDATWLEQDLPAHWQQHPLLESYAGKLVYRRRFAFEGLRTEGRGLSLNYAMPATQSSALSP